MKNSRFWTLEWSIAWRHLGVGEQRNSWASVLGMVAVYIILVGVGFAVYAGRQSSGEEMNTLEQTYGLFAGGSAILGALMLLFSLATRFFNLLSTLIMFSVLIGTMALVVVLSLMGGIEGDLRDKILNQKAHLQISGQDGNRFSDYMELVDRLDVLDGVAGVSPYLEGEVMVRSNIHRQGASLYGVLPDRLAQVTNLRDVMYDWVYEHLEHPEQITSSKRSGEQARPWRLRHLEPGKVTKSQKGAEPASDSKDAEKAKSSTDRLETIKKVDGVPLMPPRASDRVFEPKALKNEDGWEDPDDVLKEIRPSKKARTKSAKPTSTKSALLSKGSDSLVVRKPLLPSFKASDDDWEDPVEELKLADTTSVSARTQIQHESDREPPKDGPSSDASSVSPHGILIGRELAMEVAVGVGAPVQLITPIGRMTPAGRVPGVLASRIAGVFYAGMYEYDRKNVYMPLESAQLFLKTGDRVTGIHIKLDDIEDVRVAKVEIQEVLDSFGRSDSLQVQTWEELNRRIFSAMFLERIAMFVALLFVIVVASFGILSSNLMSVLEKAKEIAILKAMGSDDVQIRQIFVREGLCVGILGAAFGIILGLASCFALDRYGFPLGENMYYIDTLPVVVNPIEVLVVGLSALLIVWLSSLYPALVASRMRPADGLRQGE